MASVGKSDGFPIFHFHGNGTSRLEIFTVAAAIQDLGIRLIGLDRPGIGRSDPLAGYRLLDWPDDVAEVADQLGIEQFAVEGVSGGGPYALACAYKIPQRLTACGLISPAPPSTFIRKAGPRRLRVASRVLEYLPWLLQPLVRLSMRQIDVTSIEKRLIQNGTRLGAADQKLLEVPEIRRYLAQATAESFRQGVDANLQDGMIFTRPWGFQIEEITFERIFLWQGEQDRLMSVAPVRLLAQTLPHCTAVFYPDEGHLSTFVNHAQDIWKTLNA